MKNILPFKSKHHHPKKPSDLVRKTHDLLLLYSQNPTNNSIKPKQQKKIQQEVSELIEKLHVILYGDPETLPNPKACDELTLEFFKDNTNNPLRLLIASFPKLEFECQKFTSEVVASLLHQKVGSHFIAVEYVEENLDIVDVLIRGLFDSNNNSIALLLYDVMVRECVRGSQKVTRHILESEQHMKMFLEFAQVSDFTFASHVMETLEVLLTGHRLVVAEFLSRNYEFFFGEFNSKLLESCNKFTKFHAVKVLARMLLDKSNHEVMAWYVRSVDNLKIVMNLLIESKCARLINAFDVFKLFVANEHKPKGVVDILSLNRNKLLRFIDDFKIDTKDEQYFEQFEADKAQVMREIAALKEINLKPISVTL